MLLNYMSHILIPGSLPLTAALLRVHTSELFLANLSVPSRDYTEKKREQTEQSTIQRLWWKNSELLVRGKTVSAPTTTASDRSPQVPSYDTIKEKAYRKVHREQEKYTVWG